MKYYERLKDMREDHDLKQSDIAKILNTTSQKISEYENGNIKTLDAFNIIIGD